MEKKTVFIFVSNRDEAMWLMDVLQNDLESTGIRTTVHKHTEVLQTTYCKVIFHHDLVYLRSRDFKADEIFNFPGDSGLEFRKPSDTEPWPRSYYEYIIKTEMEGNRIDTVENSRQYFDSLWKSIYGGA